jgi:hypothetical protein
MHRWPLPYGGRHVVENVNQAITPSLHDCKPVKSECKVEAIGDLFRDGTKLKTGLHFLDHYHSVPLLHGLPETYFAPTSVHDCIPFRTYLVLQSASISNISFALNSVHDSAFSTSSSTCTFGFIDSHVVVPARR